MTQARQDPSPVQDQQDFSVANQDLLLLMQAVVANGERFRFRAAGDSMLPAVKDGDVLTLAQIEPRSSLVGRVVACLHPQSGTLIVHRVIRQRQGACLLKGDNCPGEPDGWVATPEILAELVEIERSGRSVSFGLGSEAQVIALLSRWNLLHPLLNLVWKIRQWLK